jgi:hypothetical protein
VTESACRHLRAVDGLWNEHLRRALRGGCLAGTYKAQAAAFHAHRSGKSATSFPGRYTAPRRWAEKGCEGSTWPAGYE